MKPGSRRAWTEIVTPEDYERHMAAVGQAQAAASLTQSIIGAASLRAGSRVTIVGAGTGQLMDYLDARALHPFRLTFTDINPAFLKMVQERLSRHRLTASVLVDDLERTRLPSSPDLLLAALVLEHIDWRAGVKAIARIRPKFCGFVLQENPPGMDSALTPGRKVPPSIAEAMTVAHPTLVPRREVIRAMARAKFRCEFAESVPVADRKQLIGLLFRALGGRSPAKADVTPSASRRPLVRLAHPP